jgi:hypothetical protein
LCFVYVESHVYRVNVDVHRRSYLLLTLLLYIIYLCKSSAKILVGPGGAL